MITLVGGWVGEGRSKGSEVGLFILAWCEGTARDLVSAGLDGVGVRAIAMSSSFLADVDMTSASSSSWQMASLYKAASGPPPTSRM